MPIELFGTPLHSTRLRSRAVTMENPRGEVASGGRAEGGRKGAPCLWNLEKDRVFTFADIRGPGCIRHIWITVQNSGPNRLRNLILRFYWDDQEHPSVEVPLADFFGVCHGRNVHHESAFLATPEGKAFNCCFPMPFARRARLEVHNDTGEDAATFFFQVDYTLGDEVTPETPRFHAQFRRVPQTTLYEDYVILDGVRGRGRFLGANIGVIDHVAHPDIWWGEGEVKIYLDGDDPFPTICGTGAEDYAGSGWGLGPFHCREYGAPMAGAGARYISFYRFHGHDPVYFDQSLKVTIQQIGNDGTLEQADPEGPLKEFIAAGKYRKDRRDGLFERVDDYCSTAYWYQTLPTAPFPAFPDRALRSRDLDLDNGAVS